VQSILGVTSHVADLARLDGQSVVVVGGGAVGLDVVEVCALAGARVTVVEQLLSLGGDLDVVAAGRVPEMLAHHNVRVLTGRSLIEVGDGWVQVRDPDGVEVRLDCSATFVCLGMRPAVEPYEALAEHFAGTGVNVLNVGDSAGVGKIIDATRAGRAVLAAIERRSSLTE
jgi:NADPH-dependent 2,4-dienoyl-CoA reductase/sulfur reductase-like enzyme